MQTLKLTKKYEKYPEYKDSGVEWFGKVPKDWQVGPLRSVLVERVEKNKKLVTDNILSVMKDVGVIRYADKGDVGNKSSDRPENYKIVHAGDIVLNSMNLVIGSVGQSKELGVTSSVYIIYYPRNKEIFADYYHYLFRNKSWQKTLGRLGKGIMELRESINSDLLKIEPVPIPPFNQQKAIVAFLDKKTSYIDRIIENKQKLIELLREKRTSVINNAVTIGLTQKVELVESGIAWIGKMPKGWRLDKIKRVALINKKTLSENTNPNFSFKYFDIGSVDEEEVSNVESEITFEKAPSRARRIVSVGDSIIATVRTYLKAIAYFDKLDTDTVASTGFAVLTPKKELIPKYLFYYLQSDRFINQVIIKSKGIGYPAITPFDLGSLEIIYPDKNIQQSIVTYLDESVNKYNSIIEKAEKSINLLSEFKSSLISSVVTGKIKV
ncbi:MAG: restriction endonuclease subunit S [Candidatus Paceibacterota bacterium]